MMDDRDVLERLEPLFPAPENAFEGCLRLRDRKRRNQRIGAIAVAAIITAALVGSLLSSSIGSRRRPADTGVITPSNVSTLELSWTGRTRRDPAIGLTGLTVANSTLYVISPDDAKLSAFPVDCAVDGGRCGASWTANIPTDGLGCRPVRCIGFAPAGPPVADGLVFMGGLHRLTAFPADCPTQTCRPVWIGRTVAIAHQAVVADGVVFVGTGGGYLYAFPVACAYRCAPLWVSERQPTSLQVSQVVDGVVYAAADPVWGNAIPGSTRANAAYAFPAACDRACEPIWTAPLPADLAAPLTVSEGTIYVSRTRGDLSVLNAYEAGCGIAPRCRSWSVALPPATPSSPVVAEGKVLVTIPDVGEVRAYPTECAGRCAPVWSVTVPGLSDVRPVAAGGLLFVGSTHGVAAIPLDCGSSTVACLPLPVQTPEAGEITVADGRLFVRSPNGTVSAFAPRERSTDEPITSDGRSAASFFGLLVLAVAVGLILLARSRRKSFGSA
jgi:outer membrane protein assembly factor BamB